LIAEDIAERMEPRSDESRVRRLLATRPEMVLSPLLFFVLLGTWYAATTWFTIPEFVLPPPGKVWDSLVTGLSASPSDAAGYWYHFFVTLTEALLGFLIGSSVGIVLGMAIAHSRLLSRVLYPYIIAMQSLPKVAIAPLFVVWFGFGMEPKVLITSVITFFPLLINSIAGCATVDVDRLELARSLGASRWQVFTKITFPSAIPFIFAGLNMAAVLSILGAIVGEFVGAQAGLGVLILQYNSNIDIASVYSLFVVLAAIGLTLHLTMRWLERRFCFWAQRSKQESAQEVV
jgi:NitT/TauT family transport system permease protein